MDRAGATDCGGDGNVRPPALLLRAVLDLRARVLGEGGATFSAWAPHLTREAYRASAENLAHYLALRRQDLALLQHELAYWGVSSLGRSEIHVAQNIDAVVATLAALAGEPLPSGLHRPSVEEYGHGAALLREQKHRLFGSDPDGPHARIMVTLPPQAASDEGLCAALIAAGVDSVRINCAHDEADVWRAMAENVRAAARAAGRTCPILIDLAGAKLRISGVAGEAGLRVKTGDLWALVAEGQGTWPVPTAYCSDLLAHPGTPRGEQVCVDDGKIVCVVEEARADGVLLRVIHAKDKGAVVRAGRGVTCPTATVRGPALSAKDLADLDFVVAYADMVGFSFAQTPQDVRLLQHELAARGRPAMPIVLKVETRTAVENLPGLIVAAAGRQPAAVMLARGDLALALGFERLAEVQEEILWLCEAAQLPTIWATQVLERLIRKGRPSRAEATDAAMAQRAECVMLNKGPHLVEGVRFLEDVLRRMDRHQAKKSPRLGALHAWDGEQALHCRPPADADARAGP